MQSILIMQESYKWSTLAIHTNDQDWCRWNARTKLFLLLCGSISCNSFFSFTFISFHASSGIRSLSLKSSCLSLAYKVLSKSYTRVHLMIIKVIWSPSYPHQVFHHHYHLSHPAQSSPTDMVVSINPELIRWKSWQSQSSPFFRNLSSLPLSTRPGRN